MTSHLDLQNQEDAFKEAKEKEIAKIAKDRNKSLEDAAQIWEDESQED